MTSADQTDATLKSTILILKDYFLEYLRKWYIYLLIGGLFVGYAYVKAKKRPTTYTGVITFMTTADSPTRFSGILQLAGQLGINTGSGSEVKSEKILELLSSKYIVYSTMLKKVEVNGKTEFLFNHYLEQFKTLDDLVKTDTSLQNFKFTSADLNDFSFKENKVATHIYKEIFEYYLSTNISQNGIMRAECTSISEPFSKEFTGELVKTLSDYYIKKTVEQEYQAYRLIEKRVDSLYRLLIGRENALADWIDNHRNALRAGTLSASVMMQQTRLESEAEVLSVMYSEAARNREIAKMNLVAGTPVIQIIDFPTYPLPEKRPSALMPSILALLTAGVLLTVAITLNKLIRDAFST